MANMRELASFYRGLQEQVLQAGGELTPELEEALNSHEDSLDSKADAIRVIWKELEADARRDREEADIMAKKATLSQKMADRWKEWVKASLEMSGLSRVGKRVPLRLQLNSTPKFTWENPLAPIPEGFRKVTVELDTKACNQVYRNPEGILPPGIGVARGKHIREVYSPPKDDRKEATDESLED